MRAIKLIVAIVLLIAVANLPYSYYAIMRVIVMVGAATLCYNSFKAGDKILPFIYGGIVILFQPFYKFPFHKNEWQVIDILLAIFLILSASNVFNKKTL